MWFRISGRFPAPKLFAMGTPKPQAIPIQNPSTRNWTLLDAPTLARALAPSALPTIAASIILYVCCSIFPTRRGTANPIIKGSGLPSVIFFAITSSPFIPAIFTSKQKLTEISSLKSLPAYFHDISCHWTYYVIFI